MSEAVEQVSAVLDGMGAPRALAPRLLAALGPTAATDLTADPWLLLRLPQVTVEQTDFCARRALGERAHPDDPRRTAALTEHTLRTAAARGHTAVEEKRLASLVGRLGVNAPAQALEAAVAGGAVAVFESTDDSDDDFDFAEDGVPDLPDPDRFYALTDLGHAEQRLGEQLVRLISANDPIMDSATAAETVDAACGKGGFTVSEHTRAALVTVALRPVTVLWHGPGDSAETARALACLAAIADESQVGITVVAPTAQAAAAVAADLAEVGQGDPGTRVLSLAGAVREGPLTSGLVVLCESMAVGVTRAAALASLCSDGAHLVLLADPRQAPSATPGRVAEDIVRSRTAHTAEVASPEEEAGPGPIAALALAVSEGEVPHVDAPGREVVRVPAASAEEAAHRVVQLVTDSIPRALGVPAEEVRVVAAREDGPAGARALNVACKERLNPGPGALGGFDPGDAVLLVAEGPGFGPGDTGVLRGPVEGGVEVELTGGAKVTVTDPAALRPGWALTVAAAHGGRWPAVVGVFPPGVPVSRPQVYTVLTRAVRHVSLVDATDGALETGVRETTAPERVTRLVRVLREG
ncbi:helix-hairpin-helix domain-containing protein [Nocardiopsis lambiniae]|uniref:Helix-hairpin-helix domain-containing protein n=1 Tax=Nocardiopsis lambiniae TaxID=3075539 RepID=A0ABU2MH16_9ACTN|nr:helix-hairpin-helix domain-containing protein [Nocardiopsis sp. DSM 44743]MDT0331996.1 helix-hairpin-helix domain-containing protein [Nocardiopsis sp. DSM 44743]